jgi:hypothetical protein
MNITGQNLGGTHVRDDKQKAPPALSFSPSALPPLINKSSSNVPVFIAPPPLLDNKLARRSYTQLQAMVPPSEQLTP